MTRFAGDCPRERADASGRRRSRKAAIPDRLSRAVLLAVLGAASCVAAAPGPGASQPGSAGRSSDRLLSSVALRRVVELQARRDGAALVSLLEAEDAPVRARAALALASVQDPSAVPALLSSLRDDAEEVRADVAFALGQIADSTVADELLERLSRERAAAVRRLLLDAVGKVGGASAPRRLSQLELAQADLASAALALARLGTRGLHDPGATERLADLLRAGDPEVRRSAAYYFGRSPDPDPWRALAPRVRESLDALLPADPAAMHLALALGRLGDAEDTERLARLLVASSDWRVRVNAARALAARDAAAATLAQAALEDPSHHVRLAAAEVLAGLDSIPRPVAERLSGRVAPPSGGATDEHAGILLPVLAAAARESVVRDWLSLRPAADVRGRAAALRALGAGSDTASFRLLAEHAAGADAALAAAAADALARRWRRERRPGRAAAFFQALRPALAHRDVAVVAAVAPVLADTLFRDPGGAAALAEAYRAAAAPGDADAMAALLRAMGDAGDSVSLPLLREAAGHPHREIRSAAAAALLRLGEEPPVGDVSAGEEGAGGTPFLAVVPWEDLRRLGSAPLLVLETERGRVALRLDAEQAPATVAAIARLAEEGRYDGVPFHRVVPNFVAQGGDVERGDGYGGPGFRLPSEFTRRPFRRGTVGMASAGKDTEGSQFFITHSMQPHLDGRYTAFGAVVGGMEVVDRIRQGDLITAARVLPGG